MGCVNLNGLVVFSFTKNHRILHSSEFKKLLQNRPLVHSNFFRVYVSKKAPLTLSQPVNRLGLVIPKRFCKLAVHRNFIKRQLRELFRKTIGAQMRAGNALGSFDIVVYLNKPLKQFTQHKTNIKKDVQLAIHAIAQKIKKLDAGGA